MAHVCCHILFNINRDLSLCPLRPYTKALLCAWVNREAPITSYVLYGHCQLNELPPCSPPLSHTPSNICHWSVSQDKQTATEKANLPTGKVGTPRQEPTISHDIRKESPPLPKASVGSGALSERVPREKPERSFPLVMVLPGSLLLECPTFQKAPRRA